MQSLNSLYGLGDGNVSSSAVSDYGPGFSHRKGVATPVALSAAQKAGIRHIEEIVAEAGLRAS